MPGDDQDRPIPHDRWWTPDDLAHYMRMSEKTIRNWASQKPENLPPRIRSMTDLRWEPGVCIEWSKKQSAANDATRTVGGRKRIR